MPELLAAIAKSNNVLLRAPTGAGKTTRVPGALLDQGFAEGGEILVLQPRRLAARASARRTAKERGVVLGKEVGYQVRFDNKRSSETRITFMTEGVFLRRLQHDPFLEGISVVLFDEFHERHLDTDLALAMARKVQLEVREDLKLVLMSATLDLEGLQEFLGNPPLVESEGRGFPVEIRYLTPAERPLRGELQAEDIARFVARALKETDGDVLVFLPGVGEIRRLAELLERPLKQQGQHLIELYGDLSPEEQDQALEQRAGRSVFLATNVAETSITLPKVTAVVDSGWMRAQKFDPAHGLDRLVLLPISRANADQRSGRAGRTRPGVAYRLWTSQEERARPAQTPPEIRRVDCTGALLQLVTWGEAHPRAFPWLEAPPVSASETAHQCLELLGAIEVAQDGFCRLTECGAELSRMPVHPRLARLIQAGAARGVAREAALGAALLSERSPFRREGRRNSTWAGSVDSDLIDGVRALDEFERSGQRVSDAGELSPIAAKSLLRLADKLMRSAPKQAPENPKMEWDEALARALLEANGDRLARRRGPEDERAVMVGGRGVRLARESNVRTAELFLCLQVDAGAGEGLVRSASEVKRAWLDPKLLLRDERLSFDEAEERVVARQCLAFNGLELESKPATLRRNAASARVLAEAASVNLERALDLRNQSYVNLKARLQLLNQWMPELELPEVNHEFLRAHLEQLCHGKLSFKALRESSLAGLLKQQLDWKQKEALERMAPERMEVPSGNHVALHYEEGKPPVLAARIQELFGWKDTPRIAAGRQPLLLHLLAPNMRPQQVTDDLASFWNNTYADVRKDLRRRYPKHDWPEDPWTAVARKRRR